MEQLVFASGTINLYLRDTDRWQIFSFTGDSTPRGDDLIPLLDALKNAVTDKPVAFAVEAVPHPNSRLLSAVIGMLTTRDDQPRHVALINASQTWLDMLDILGVRSGFLLVDSVEEITFEE